MPSDDTNSDNLVLRPTISSEINPPNLVNSSSSYNQRYKRTEGERHERVQWFLVRFVVLLSLLSVIVCWVTKDARMIGLTWPLLVIIRYYFPKQGLR
jgi:hypothetical protein